tara:strand:+ start:27639 stop:29960 length:2322 start_codon:yes stop_codon:yes gene_type:complete
MKDTIRLSIILTTHAKEHHFNELLSEVLQFKSGNYEIIIINDGSDVVTSKFIEREISKSENERVYLYEHSQYRGRGISLNEAILQAEGSIVWAPLRADKLNEGLLAEAVNRFASEAAAFWVLDYNLPEDVMKWVDASGEGDLPDDSCLVWNKNVITPKQLFFNPFMDYLHGAELAFRLKNENRWIKTDPFFVISEDQSVFAGPNDQKEFLYSGLRMNVNQKVRQELIEKLGDADFATKKIEIDNQNLVESRHYLQKGDANKALELINQYLKRNPTNQEALRIKITSLEKLRRHVEAAELKHNIFKEQKAEKAEKAKEAEEAKESEETYDKNTAATAPEVNEEAKPVGEIELSVVIPTTGHGKVLLEQTLLKLDEAVDSDTTELIIVDNASIDDTFDYLEQLTKKSFLNIKVIVNQINKGFAASVNQGIELAKGKYVLVMHNDVLVDRDCPAKLINTFKQSEEFAITAPLVDKTDHKAQQPEPVNEEKIFTTETVDSCCFMIRKTLHVRMDEGYQACYFEMNDFCNQVREQGGTLAVCASTRVVHHQGSSIKSLAFHLNPEAKWKNRARFLKKWSPGKERKLPTEGNHAMRFQKLGAPYNPMNPDDEWVNMIRKYLTNEVRTEILRNKWTEEELYTIVLTLLIADERELLRTMEDRLLQVKPDNQLLTLFILYYYNKNIFSRCRHYIQMADDSNPIFELFQLKMMVTDKDFDRAIPLLNRLLESHPSSPELFYLAAEVYKESNEEGEAKSFYAMANQLDPFRFRADEAAFDINI